MRVAVIRGNFCIFEHLMYSSAALIVNLPGTAVNTFMFNSIQKRLIRPLTETTK